MNTVLLDVAGPLWTITINRPHVRNAVDGPNSRRLAEVFRRFDAEPQARVAVLTGAHVVANATFVQVQKLSDPTKLTARVVAISHDSDLALMRVEERSFAKGIRPATIGELPRLRDAVQVVGYPIGGEEVSITEGVASRIEVQRYEHSQRHLLAVTVDAAINEGNSGGPVFGRGKVVGIAFQSLPDAENTWRHSGYR